jgi:hypothetical protein
MQFNIFKIIMQSNVATIMEARLHVNPLTRLWWTLEASHIWWHSFLEFFKLAKIVRIQILGSMEDEWTFSTFFFMISKLRNHLNEHFNTIVGMYSQFFYNLNIFSYDACFEDLKEQKPMWALDFYFHFVINAWFCYYNIGHFANFLWNVSLAHN